MNDRQNTVVATVLAALLLGTIFFCPWRVESSGEVRWSPIYQTPISYVRSYDDSQSRKGVSRFEYDDAEIAFDLLLLQILAVGAAGGLLYRLAGDREEDASSEPLGKESGRSSL